MNQDTTNNQKKPEKYPGFAITSLIIGIIMMVTALYYIWHSIVLAFAGGPGFHPPIASLIFAFCADVAGFFSGIIGLISHKKRVATTGIVLCSLPIILVILVQILAHPFFW